MYIFRKLINKRHAHIHFIQLSASTHCKQDGVSKYDMSLAGRRCLELQPWSTQECKVFSSA